MVTGCTLIRKDEISERAQVRARIVFIVDRTPAASDSRPKQYYILFINYLSDLLLKN